MLGIYNETKDTMKFRFDGENSIDATELIKFLEKTVGVFNEIVTVSDKDVFFKLEVKAMEKGSFSIIIASLIQETPRLFSVIKHAKDVFSTFKEMLEVKKMLKDDKIKEINGKEIITINGNHITLINKPTQVIMSNEENLKRIDDKITDFSESLPNRVLHVEDNQSDFVLTDDVKKTLEIPLVIEEEKGTIIDTSTVIRDLIIKKPDFSMKSMWEFTADKKIKATIADENFKEAVLSGRFKTHHGHKIKVEMEEINEYTSDYETILNSHYKILKVLDY